MLGVFPLGVGVAGSLWTLGLHFAASRGRLDWEPDKSYLITRGPYALSRNPMYLFELTLQLGWVVLYGSIAVFVAFLAWWAWFSFFQVPQEERAIEARFGEAYREYRSRVSRWFGKPRG
jgi:protein-S-isoprenylcysteine O-methyltransferase Ste14